MSCVQKKICYDPPVSSPEVSLVNWLSCNSDPDTSMTSSKQSPSVGSGWTISMKTTISFSRGVSIAKNLHFLLSWTAKAIWKSSSLTWIRLNMSKQKQSGEGKPVKFEWAFFGARWCFWLSFKIQFDHITGTHNS